MEVKDLRIDDIIIAWLRDIMATKATRENYLESMHQYSDFVRKSPSELIQEAESEIRAGMLLSDQQLIVHLREFRASLESIGNAENDNREELAPLTIKNRMTAVRSFYKWKNIPIPALPKAAKRAKAQLKRKKLPEKDHIRAILRVAGPLERAIVLVGVSSGLSAIDIANLKIRDFKDGLDEKTGITTIHIIREKTQYEFYTFFTPETTQAVQEYLEYRKRVPKIEDSKHGKRRAEQLEKQRIVSDDGYLFVLRSVPDEYLTAENAKKKEKMRAWNTVAILAMYRRLNEEAKTSAAKGEYNINRTHNMRRFFASALLGEGCQQYIVDYLQGHEIDATHEGYFRGNPLKLRAEYEKYIPLLTIQKAIDISESPEYLKIKQENQILQTETAKHVVERSELQELRAKVEKLEAEKKDMTYAYWDTVADHMEEKKITEHDFEMQQQKIDELYKLVAALTKDIDIDKPLTKAEKKNIPEW